MERVCVGILAHVDSGKTTLSEALLYHGGSIRKMGRVDHEDAFLDNDAMERRRGITIFSKTAVLSDGEKSITLLDTPGHTDFSAETERTLSVLDAAILVISATEGVREHTETLWKLLRRRNIPTFLFFNKMDMPSADRETLMSGVKKRLSDSCIEYEKIDDAEEAAMCDSHLMEAYLNDEALSDEQIIDSIRRCKLFPCFFGSALKDERIEEFWQGFLRLFPLPPKREEFGARVYKIGRDENGKRLTYMKLTGGSLSVKNVVEYRAPDGESLREKVDELRIYSGAKYEAVQRVEQGTICAVAGLSKTAAGDVLGFEKVSETPILEPVFRYRVLLPDGLDAHKAFAMLRELEEEDPTLRIRREEHTGDICLLLMGPIRLEVLKQQFFDRFGYSIDFDVGRVVYRETIADTVEGAGHYEPLRHYAEVRLLLEPTERGSGLSFCCDCPTEMLERSFQRLILTHLEEKTHVGVLTGSPITDMRITLVAGRAHKKHTEGGDFREATYRALRQGLRRAESVLLEPWYCFTITLPSAQVGRAMSDIQRMGGETFPPELDGDTATLRGSAPATELQHYGLTLSDYSHGNGRISCTLRGYEPCHDRDEVIRSIAYDPDADLYNSCDSVFCAGGAGFLVKWDQVENHMHTESVLSVPSEEIERRENLKRRAENYLRAAATDRELTEIFERTYGKIRRKQEGKVRREAPQAPPKPAKVKVPPPPADEYLLIDGYNIIFAWDELKKTAASSLELARSELIHRVCNYRGVTDAHIILVFDAYRVKKSSGSVEQFGDVSVVYTKEAETADSYIERVSHELSRKNRVRVATSDGSEQMIILGNGALRVPAAAFHKELTDAEKAIRECMENLTY